ncbi:MAG: hypothetical protein K2X87_31005 [Gemmataceae bacterium]|nr:hypothetical protein [Gemmataceae bacterium]
MRTRLAAVFALAVTSGGLHPRPANAEENKPPKEFAALKYRLVGPFAGGRVSRACGVPGDPLTYYAATASGGVWKSADGGLTWKPVFDDQPTSSVGSIAVAPSDPNVVYVGTGEANIRGNVAPGAGIFKSTDAGKTWQHVWKQVGQIGTMAVHPKNPEVAYAAVLGHAFGPNAERGLYRTTDGGKTWQQVLAKDADTGCSDVALDPSNPRTVFAGMWQARRKPWEMTSGGPGSDLQVSRDGGDTWKSLKAAKGLPAGVWGKVCVAVAPSNGQRVYAIIEANEGGLFRSDDGGETWEKTSDDRRVRQRAWYYSTLTVHPTNPDIVYLPQVPLLKSSDGGRTFASVPGPHHGDHHDLWIDPRNPQRMINANDGGVDLTADGGKTWYAPPLPISQCYHVSADNRTPYRVMACLQDLGSASGPSHSLLGGGIGLGDWYGVGGGEAGYAFADPSDPNVVYAGEYGGIMTRYDHRTGQARNVTVNQVNPSGIDPAKMKYRFQWTAPILISQHDPKTVYHAANVLFRTKDAGQTWEKVSDDLSKNDKQKQQWSGGPITGDNTGVEIYGTIFALAESPKQQGLIWAGTDDGKVHLTRDDCKTWTDVTANVPELPDWGTVSCIEASPHDPGTAYLVVRNYRLDDYRPYVWKTTDFGKTWTKITDGLNPAVHLHAVREDTAKKGLLYLGTERGVMFSPDAGKTWQPLQLNLPTVPVHDLVVKGDDLVVGTHGRSIWILDDLTPVREMSAAVREKPAHLFPVRPAVKWSVGGGGPTRGFNEYTSGDNPAAGAAVWFHLKDEPKAEVKVEVLDAAGKVIATAKAKGKPADKPADEAKEAKDEGKSATKPDDEKDEDKDKGDPKDRKLEAAAGLSRWVWDLTHDGAEAIAGSPADLGSADQRVPVAPGKYTIRLTVGKDVMTQPVEVRPDPRIVAAADRKEFFAFTPGTQVGGGDAIGADLQARERLGLPEVVYLPRPGDAPAQNPAAQEKLALRVRDDISKLSDAVNRIRAIKKQIALRKDLLKENKDAKDLLKESVAFDKKLDEVEGKLHNAKAKISYDIFAARGGAMLYSQLTWLLASLTDGDGAPTKAQVDLAAELEKELAGLVGQFDKLAADDLAKLNEAAKKLGVPELYVPPAKKKAEPKKDDEKK